MANIIIPPKWQNKNLKPTDESLFLNRRSVVKQMGIIGAGLLSAPTLLTACTKQVNSEPVQGKVDNNFTFQGMDQLYPAKRNGKYLIDRPITEEKLATTQNNFYEFISPNDPNIYNAHKYVSKFDTRNWNVEVSGYVKRKGRFSLEDMIRRFGLEERTYRFRCVEAWSMAVPWTGFHLAKLINYLEPESRATHIRMISFSDPEQMPGVKHQTWYPWPYFEGLRMDEAMNGLSLMVTGAYGKPLAKQNGAPLRLITPWKYGYKSIKSVVKIEFIDYRPETFWHQLAPSEYGFFSNVNPDVPHPRWSQAQEQMLGEDFKRPTLKYNGYGDYVADLYS